MREVSLKNGWGDNSGKDGVLQLTMMHEYNDTMGVQKAFNAAVMKLGLIMMAALKTFRTPMAMLYS